MYRLSRCTRLSTLPIRWPTGPSLQGLQEQAFGWRGAPDHHYGWIGNPWELYFIIHWTMKRSCPLVDVAPGPVMHRTDPATTRKGSRQIRSLRLGYMTRTGAPDFCALSCFFVPTSTRTLGTFSCCGEWMFGVALTCLECMLGHL